MKNLLIVSSRTSEFSSVRSELEKDKWTIFLSKDDSESNKVMQTSRVDLIISALEEEGINGLSYLGLSRTYKPEIILLITKQDFELLRVAYEKGVCQILLYPDELKKIPKLASKIYEEKVVKNIQILNLQNRADILREQFENQHKWELLSSGSNIASIARLVSKLHNNLCQADGFGAMISLIGLIKDYSHIEGDNYLVEKEIMEQLFTSSEIGKKTLDSMNSFLNVANIKLSLEEITIMDFFHYVDTITKGMFGIAERKNQHIILSDLKNIQNTKPIRFDVEKIKLVVYELILNAIKFSKDNDRIYVIMFQTGYQFGFRVLNPAYTFQHNILGVPESYKSLVFNPFYKISDQANYDYFDIEVTGELGLGLTLVKEIVELHNGLVSIGNTLNHLEVNENGSPKVDVMVDVSFSV
ncbi:MAG: sensor histidine kinase [Leptospiraceae bacterium]|nr:sensor histidine kinase [Leptospiraceae bacterium]